MAIQHETRVMMCPECESNVFVISKTRDLASVFQQTGQRRYFCVQCNEFVNPEWETVEHWSDAKTVIFPELTKCEKRVERLQRQKISALKRETERLRKTLSDPDS